MARVYFCVYIYIHAYTFIYLLLSLSIYICMYIPPHLPPPTRIPSPSPPLRSTPRGPSLRDEGKRRHDVGSSARGWRDHLGLRTPWRILMLSQKACPSDGQDPVSSALEACCSGVRACARARRSRRLVSLVVRHGRISHRCAPAGTHSAAPRRAWPPQSHRAAGEERAGAV